MGYVVEVVGMVVVRDVVVVGGVGVMSGAVVLLDVIVW